MSVCKHTTEKGFTILEVMIAMTIFTVVVTIGIGSVLTAINQHYSTQNTRTVMDSLNYSMEDMARNIRLGFNIRCGASPLVDSSGMVVPLSCPLASDAHNIVTFNAQDGSVLSYAISTPSSGVSQILKQKGSSAVEIVTPPEVKMDFADSGFTVRGAEPGDGAQPSVIIRLSGTITYKGIDSKFAIETAVTPRALDS